MSVQMRAAEEASSQAEEMLENEQIEKRGLEEQLSEITVSVSSVIEITGSVGSVIEIVLAVSLKSLGVLAVSLKSLSVSNVI